MKHQQSLDEVLEKLKKPPKQTQKRKKSPVKNEDFFELHKTPVKQSPQSSIYNPKMTTPPKPYSVIEIESTKDMTSDLPQFFEGFNFVIIPFGLSLTPKRAGIFATAIKNRGGNVVDLNTFDWEKANPMYYFIIISRAMKYGSLLQMVSEISYHKLDDFNFIDCEWLSECFKADDFVNPRQFYIYFSEIANKENEIPIEKLRVDSPIRIEKIHDPSQRPMTPEFGSNLKQISENNEEIEIIEETIPLTNEEVLIIPKRPKVKHNKALMQQARRLYDYNYGTDEKTLIESEASQSKKDLSDVSQRGSPVESDEALLEDEEEEHQNLILAFRSGGKITPVIQTNEDDKDKLIEQKLWHSQEREYNEPIFSPVSPITQKEKSALLEASSHENYNIHITEPLERIMLNYEAHNDQGRVHAYRRAIASIRSYPKRIQNAEEVKGLYGIGPKIYEKVKEILATGHLRQAEKLAEDSKARVINEFMKVYGMGIETSNKLYLEGCRTINDLREHEHLLNSTQKLGLKYYEDFLKRTPREEVDQILKIIRDAMMSIADRRDMYEMVCCGSYRRRRSMLGDIDLLFSRKDGKKDPEFLDKLVRLLISKGVLVDHFILPNKSITERRQTYMGILKWKGHHIKLDMLFYPRECFAYGLLAWTGSGNYVRELRLLAKQKGLNLEDHGMYYKVDPTGRMKGIVCDSEEEIFKMLGLEYKKPEDRDL